MRRKQNRNIRYFSIRNIQSRNRSNNQNYDSKSINGISQDLKKIEDIYQKLFKDSFLYFGEVFTDEKIIKAIKEIREIKHHTHNIGELKMIVQSKANYEESKIKGPDAFWSRMAIVCTVLGIIIPNKESDAFMKFVLGGLFAEVVIVIISSCWIDKHIYKKIFYDLVLSVLTE